METTQQSNNNARFDTKLQLFIHRYNQVHAICMVVRPSKLGPNTNNNYNIISTRSHKIKLIIPIRISPDPQQDKNTKNNPHLYAQVHEEILWFSSHNY